MRCEQLLSEGISEDASHPVVTTANRPAPEAVSLLVSFDRRVCISQQTAMRCNWSVGNGVSRGRDSARSCVLRVRARLLLDWEKSRHQTNAHLSTAIITPRISPDHILIEYHQRRAWP